MKVPDVRRNLVPDTWTADGEGARPELGPCPHDNSYYSYFMAVIDGVFCLRRAHPKHILVFTFDWSEILGGYDTLDTVVRDGKNRDVAVQLRSSTTNAAVVMRTRTQFGTRAFSVCGPSIWNYRVGHKNRPLYYSV